MTRFVTSSPQMAAQDELGGPQDAWFSMMIGIGHWQWFGYGFFTLQKPNDPKPLGRVGLLNHESWPEPELAWHLYEDAIGNGFATEAAVAVRNWAAAAHGLTQLASFIDTKNTRSQSVAMRLGATTDGSRAPHEPDAEIWVHPKVAA